jgi:hypothetical protein
MHCENVSYNGKFLLNLVDKKNKDRWQINHAYTQNISSSPLKTRDMCSMTETQKDKRNKQVEFVRSHPVVYILMYLIIQISVNTTTIHND